MLFTSQEVIGKPQPKTEGTVFPNTDQPRLVNNIFTFPLNLTKFFAKEPKRFRGVITARSSINWTIFDEVNSS